MPIFSSASLLIKPTYLLFFLKPSATVPQDSTIVDGDVVLRLPAARRVKTIDVELIGTQAMRVAGRHVSYETLHLTTTLEAGMLEAGSHIFHFSFIVPSDTAPKERLGEYQSQLKGRESGPPHGGKVYATQSHLIRATAKGLGGPFGGDLVADHNVVLHALHQDGPPGGFARREQLLHPVLGPVSCRFFARYAIISGYLRMNLQMPTALEDYTVENVKVILMQDVHLEHMQELHINEDIPTHNVLLWQLSQTPNGDQPYRGMPIHRGEGLAITQVCRLPNEMAIRQTTSEYSNTGIRCSHKISLVVHYRSDRDSTSLKEFSVRFPVTISSCDSSIWNTQVPGYEEGSTVNTAIPVDQRYTHCVCLLENYIGLEAVERMYGFRDYTEPEEVYSGPEQERRAKWEIEEEQRQASRASSTSARS